MAQINFRIDDKTKREAEALFGRMGLTMSGAIMVFLRQSINERGIPFKLCLPASALTEEELLAAGIKPNTVRLSIGTEHIDDIIADLEEGFAAIK